MSMEVIAILGAAADPSISSSSSSSSNTNASNNGSSDSTLLATSAPLCCCYVPPRREIVTGGQDGRVRVWEMATMKCARTMVFVRGYACDRPRVGHKGWVTDVLWSGGVRLLFSCSIDGNVIAWSDKGKELQVVEHGSPVFCLAWNPKRRQLISGAHSTIFIYKACAPTEAIASETTQATTPSSPSPQDGSGLPKVLKLLHSLRSHSDIVRGVACSDSGRIFSASYDRSVCIYDSEKPQAREGWTRLLRCHEGAICSVAFDTDNNWFITGSYDGTVKVWSQEGRCLDGLENMADTVNALAYIKPMRHYWITGRNKRLVAYDPRTPTNVTAYVRHTSRLDEFNIQRLHASPHSDVVLGITAQRQLVVWRFNPCAPTMPHRLGRIPHRGQNRTDRLNLIPRTHTNAPTPTHPTTPTQQQHQHQHPPNTPTQQVFSGDAEGKVLRWASSEGDLASDPYICHEELNINTTTSSSFPNNTNSNSNSDTKSMLCLAYSAELDLLAAGGEDCNVRLWPLESRARSASPRGGGESDVGGDVGGNVLVSASQDGTLRWWDLHTRHELACVQAPAATRPISSSTSTTTTTSTPTTSSSSSSARRPSQALSRPASASGTSASTTATTTSILSMDYCDEREELASTTAADPVAQVHIWCSFKRVLKRTLLGHKADITQIKWCPLRGGCWLSASDDSSLRVWHPDSGECVQEGHFAGETATAMLVDAVNGCVLIATGDHAIRVFDVHTLVMLRKHVGHVDSVRALAMAPPPRSQYLSASWDRTLRVWRAGPGLTATNIPETTFPNNNNSNNSHETDYDDEDKFVSTYEQLHPLVYPASLRNARVTLHLGKEKGASTGRNQSVYRHVAGQEGEGGRGDDTRGGKSTQLAGRLQELEDRLKSDLLSSSAALEASHSHSNNNSNQHLTHLDSSRRRGSSAVGGSSTLNNTLNNTVNKELNLNVVDAHTPGGSLLNQRQSNATGKGINSASGGSSSVPASPFGGGGTHPTQARLKSLKEGYEPARKP
eukprot:jgi/Chlat1/1208/Chrsp115S01669